MQPQKNTFLSCVFAFSTIETGFWIAQEILHSEHKDLIVFSNTAPRGDIKWEGEQRQAFAAGILKNNMPVFAVHAGYNLSFIKDPQQKRSMFMKMAKLNSSREMDEFVYKEMKAQKIWQR